jgi:hypothetical protein
MNVEDGVILQVSQTLVEQTFKSPASALDAGLLLGRVEQTH